MCTGTVVCKKQLSLELWGHRLGLTRQIRVGRKLELALFTAGQKKTARHKWGVTVSWSTIGWSQMQSDCPELSDDPYSMQNSLSCWSVPTSLGGVLPAPLSRGFECNQSWTTAPRDPIPSDNNHILLKTSYVLVVTGYKWVCCCSCLLLYRRFQVESVRIKRYLLLFNEKENYYQKLSVLKNFRFSGFFLFKSQNIVSSTLLNTFNRVTLLKLLKGTDLAPLKHTYKYVTFHLFKMSKF